MACVSFGTEIASMRGAMAEKNVRRQMRTDRRTAFQLYIYDDDDKLHSTFSMAGTAVPFSKYYSELEGEAKSRYEQKVRMIGLVDPYHFLENSGPSSSPLSVEWYEWPDIMYADIYNFLIRPIRVWRGIISL